MILINKNTIEEKEKFIKWIVKELEIEKNLKLGGEGVGDRKISKEKK